MATKKVLVVFGATGNQGGSVIKSILNDPKTTKPNAKALETQGVECVAGDINDKASIKSAFDGAYAVFAMTNYWEKMDAELEFAQGKTIADLAKVSISVLSECSYKPIMTCEQESGVQHLIWSSLLNITKLTDGAFPNVEHFDSKAAVEQYIRDQEIPATFILPGFFMSNIPGQILRQVPPDNNWTLAMPAPSDTPVPLFDAAGDTGKFVKGILTHRDQVLGKRIYAASDYYTFADMVDTFKEMKSEAGKNANFVRMTKEQYKGALAKAGMPEKAQEELYENMAFMHDYGYYGKASLAESHAVCFHHSLLKHIRTSSLADTELSDSR